MTAVLIIPGAFSCIILISFFASFRPLSNIFMTFILISFHASFWPLSCMILSSFLHHLTSFLHDKDFSLASFGFLSCILWPLSCTISCIIMPFLLHLSCIILATFLHN